MCDEPRSTPPPLFFPWLSFLIPHHTWSLPRKQHSSRASVWRQCRCIYRTHKQWCALSPSLGHGVSTSPCLRCMFAFFFSFFFFFLNERWKQESRSPTNSRPVPHTAMLLDTVCAEWVTVQEEKGGCYGILRDITGYYGMWEFYGPWRLDDESVVIWSCWAAQESWRFLRGFLKLCCTHVNGRCEACNSGASSAAAHGSSCDRAAYRSHTALDLLFIQCGSLFCSIHVCFKNQLTRGLRVSCLAAPVNACFLQLYNL